MVLKLRAESPLGTALMSQILQDILNFPGRCSVTYSVSLEYCYLKVVQFQTVYFFVLCYLFLIMSYLCTAGFSVAAATRSTYHEKISMEQEIRVLVSKKCRNIILSYFIYISLCYHYIHYLSDYVYHIFKWLLSH